MPHPSDVDLGRWHYLLNADDVDLYMDALRAHHMPDDLGVVDPLDLDGLDYPVYVRSYAHEGMEYVDEAYISHDVITRRDMGEAQDGAVVQITFNALDLIEEIDWDQRSEPSFEVAREWLQQNREHLTQRCYEKLRELVEATLDARCFDVKRGDE